MGFLNGSRSRFPQEVDQVKEFYDLSPSLRADAIRYQELCAKGNLSSQEITELRALTVKLEQYIISAEDRNFLGDVVIRTQRFFKENVKDYILQKQREFNQTIETNKAAFISFMTTKKDETIRFVNDKKQEIVTFTDSKKNELDIAITSALRKANEFNVFVRHKTTELTEFARNKTVEFTNTIEANTTDFKNFMKNKKDETTTFVNDKKQEMNTFTEEKQNLLNTAIANAIKQVNTFSSTVDSKTIEIKNLFNTKAAMITELVANKTTQLTEFVSSESSKISSLVNSKSTEITELVKSKSSEINGLVISKIAEMNSLVTNTSTEIGRIISAKTIDFENLISSKAEDFKSFIQGKKDDVTQFTDSKKQEITAFVNNSKNEANEFKNVKNREIQIEIDRLKDFGLWSASKQYYAKNIVHYEGNIYIAKKNNISATPINTENPNWQILSIKGDTGYSVGLTPAGIFAVHTNYKVNQLVGYQGNLFRCKKDCKGVIPSNTTYWELFLAGNGELLSELLTNHKLSLVGAINENNTKIKAIENTSATIAYVDEKANERYTKNEVSGLLNTKANTVHTHTKSQITDFAHTHDDRYYTESEINSKLSGKANTNHTHTKSQISDFAHTHDDRYYTESEIDTKLNTKANSSHTHTKAQITDFAHRHTWNELDGKPSTFTPSSHTHTKAQITDFAHTHDDRYYTESEIDNKFKIYDSTNNGKVDVAERAESIAWSNVSGKPDIFQTSVKKTIRVLGDADKYYPVVIKDITNSPFPALYKLFIYRNYNWEAPNTWNTSTHKGGLQLYIEFYSNGWGGMNNWHTTKWKESYSNIFGGIRFPSTKAELIIYLRGGTALYDIYCDCNFTVVNESREYRITHSNAQYNETFPVLTDKLEDIRHLGKSGNTSNIRPDFSDLYYDKTYINNELNKKAQSSHTHTKAQITDFAHTHDDRYYTESEINSKLAGKSDTSHNHNSSYYTKTEADNKFAILNRENVFTVNQNFNRDIKAKGKIYSNNKEVALKEDFTRLGQYIEQETSAPLLLTKLKNVDGSNSGLDADKLDGLDSSEFARIKSAYCNVSGAAIDISNNNLEQVKNKSGLYMGINITGAPDKAWWLIESMVHNANYTNVKATKLATNQIFYGYWNNGSWSNWSKVIDSNIMTLNDKGIQMMYAGADVNSRHIEGTCPGHDGNLFLNYGNRKDVYFPDSNNGNSTLRSIHNVTKLLRNNNGNLEVNIGGVWLSVGAKQYTVVRQGYVGTNVPQGMNRFDYSGGAGILRLLNSNILYGNTSEHGVLVYLDGVQVKDIIRNYNYPSPLTPNLEFKNSISIVSVNGTGGSFIVQTEK